MADYIIYRSGVNTIARNTSTGTDQFTNASAASVFNSCTSALSSGGVLYVKRGTYDISAIVNAVDNIHIIGEHRDLTILNNTQATESAIKKTGSILTGFRLKNLTVQSPGNGSPVYFAGATRCVLDGCRFAFTSMPSSARIMVWFDSLNGTRSNFYNKIMNNIYEGATNGQDTQGGGRMDWSVISNNTFIGPTDATGAGQAIGLSGCRFLTIANNTFRDYGNFIGMEGATGSPPTTATQNCTITGNTAYNCGKLKLSLVDSDNMSRYNVCTNNTMIYGNTGIEDGNGIGDVIANNTIVRSTISAIRGTFHQCIIQGNKIVETNANGSSQSFAAGSKRAGGIHLINNGGGFLTGMTGTVVRGNSIWRSGSSYTYEPDGTTKTGAGGGIGVDSGYTKAVVVDNVLYGALTDPLFDGGTTTTLRNNDQLS